MFATRFVLLALALAGSSTATSRQVLHERRAAYPPAWSPVSRAPEHAIIPMRVGLAQRNLEKLDGFLHAVSQPGSPDYGAHWSAARIAQTFAPTQETIETVRSWLKSTGVAPERIRLTSAKAWLEVNITVAEAEQLLSTQYEMFKHEDGAVQYACDQYHLPEHVAKHIDIITPTVHFDTKIHRRGSGAGHATNIGKPGAGSVVPKAVSKIKSILNELANCSSYTTPNCLRALYGVIYVPVAAKKNSFGIVEYTPQAYVKSDMDMFFKNFSSNLVGKYPITVSIDGGVVQSSLTGFAYNGESNLDLQYAQALTQSQQITLYQVGDMVQGASFNNFLDAIDGSYCTFQGGDDPYYDAIYPDTYGTAADGAYQGTQDCGTVKPANVISTSYGYNEADLSPAYAARQCAEYAKLGLMGTTVIYSSGDYGVAGNGNFCLNSDGSQSTSGSSFNPTFPASCPYVTAAGATQLPAGKKTTDPEVAVYSNIASGGGFSNYFATPAYQASTVQSYLSANKSPYASGTFNATGRGFPDISANGANYVVAVNGQFQSVFGTSASAPVIAAMISNINDARLAMGKKPLGFINPALYSTSFRTAFNDIKSGSNPGCGTNGFNAVSGWDPVTGLGTPKFAVLLAKFLFI